jgi:Restriction endonuclease AspBHI N-terminal/Restriction endonuclease
MNNERKYRVGNEYIDDIANSREKDEFVTWLPGIGNSRGIRCARFRSFKSDVPAFVVLITREIKHKHHNPWDDIVDYGSSKIFYWGDAKYSPGKNYNDFEGNKALMKIYERYLEGKYQEVTPVLHFSKKKTGKITFNGLCIITNVETTWFEDLQKPVKNYRFELSILDSDEVNVEWLLNRAESVSSRKIDNNLRPSSWESFMNGRLKKLKLYKREILSRESQLPEANSDEEKILSVLCSLKPVEFEAVLVELLRSLPHVNHNITRTRPVKDGGFDFYGEFNLPFPFSYKIEFLGEAKKYKRSNSIGPSLISRLVARLGRGQYGIFVTTSFYTPQAQEEVLEDKYPVRLYSGMDIINFLRELKLIDNGKIKEAWLNEVTQLVKNKVLT